MSGASRSILQVLGDAVLKVYNEFELTEDERKHLTAIKLKGRDYTVRREKMFQVRKTLTNSGRNNQRVCENNTTT